MLRTCSQLHSILSGHHEGVYPDQILDYLHHRKHQLSHVSEPFGDPSDASRKQIESGVVTLPDGVSLRVDNAEKEFTFAISNKFNVDEVQALVLLRSFLYNEGLPPTADDSSTSSMIAELLDAITPFYYSERLFLLRIYIPLFRANEDSSDTLYDIASQIIPTLIPDGSQFATTLITAYSQKLKEKLPDTLQGDSKTASKWAKQNSREQLALLEVLFWTMWGYVPCSGPMVEQIYDVAYGTNLGSSQQNTMPFLLDEEGEQLRQDCAAIWMLIMVEVLELENMAEPDAIELSDVPTNKDVITASPQSLIRIHELVSSHSESQYVMPYLAWAYVLSRLAAKAAQSQQQSQQIPESYLQLPGLVSTHGGKSLEKTCLLMAKSCLSEEAGFFNLIRTLLMASPLFVTSVAWRVGSSVTDPNAIAFRSVLKGHLFSR